MMSSVMPSLKYSCSGSPLMLANGSTQMEFLRTSRVTCAITRYPRRGTVSMYRGARASSPRALRNCATA